MEVNNSSESPEILIQLENVQLIIDDADKGKGSLTLDSLYCTWKLNDETSFSWGYRDILMHATSKESGSPCIYAQMNGEHEDELVEVRFVPEDANQVENLYTAFSRGACLNPDVPGDEEEAGNFYFNADEVEAGLENGDYMEDEFEDDQ